MGVLPASLLDALASLGSFTSLELRLAVATTAAALPLPAELLSSMARSPQWRTLVVAPPYDFEDHAHDGDSDLAHRGEGAAGADEDEATVLAAQARRFIDMHGGGPMRAQLKLAPISDATLRSLRVEVRWFAVSATVLRCERTEGGEIVWSEPSS